MNDNSVSLYKFHNNEIRVVMIDGEPWFVAADVCRALGMPNTSVFRHLNSLKDAEKQLVNQNTFGPLRDIRRGNPNASIISESGLYKLVLRSNKPEVRPFQEWVNQVVLPAIRKDGACSRDEEESSPEQTVVPAPPFGANQPLTMSSREIAELLGSRHDNVRVTVERLANKGVIASPAMQDFKNINGVTGKEYLLDKRSSLIVVAQLSPEFTARVVDRWQELEEQVRKPVFVLPNFEDPVAAARAWADAEEGRAHEQQRAIAAEERLAEVEPKVACLNELKNKELDRMPVNKFLGHHDVYVGLSMRRRLSFAAKRLCISRDVDVIKRRRVLDDGEETYVNEYPHSFLIEAAEVLGITLLNNRYRPEAA